MDKLFISLGGVAKILVFYFIYIKSNSDFEKIIISCIVLFYIDIVGSISQNEYNSNIRNIFDRGLILSIILKLQVSDAEKHKEAHEFLSKASKVGEVNYNIRQMFNVLIFSIAIIGLLKPLLFN